MLLLVNRKMETILSNTFLRVKAKTKGAELCSILDQRDNTEHLWQADPKFWDWHAPVLFPKIGESVNQEISFSGKKFPMQKHGLARHLDFTADKKSETEVVFTLRSNDETLKQYPFRFCFQIKYMLEENTLKNEYIVANEDDKSMPFTVGGHPAFAVPFLANEKLEDYFLEFEKPETISRYLINENGLFNGVKEVVLNNEKIIPITKQLFNRDALIFKEHQSRKISICSKNHNKKLRAEFADFPYLGIWAKPGAPYVCIEPWIGCAEDADKEIDFTEKEHCIVLQPGEKFSCAFSVTIE